MRNCTSFTPGGWPEGLQSKALKGAEPILARPGSLLPPADLVAKRAEAEKKCGRQLSDEEFVSFLMYPKVLADYAATLRHYGPLSALPTRIFFYGMTPGEEISVELEPGKSLVVRWLAIGETDEEGQIKLFFELNGQPRIARVPNRLATQALPVRRKAKDEDDTQVGAPMPGAVAPLAVRVGRKVKTGDIVATLEAMKMETALHASRAGKVMEILIAPGQQVDTNDLMIVIG